MNISSRPRKLAPAICAASATLILLVASAGAAARANAAEWYAGPAGGLTLLQGSAPLGATLAESKFETGKWAGQTAMAFELNTELGSTPLHFTGTSVEAQEATIFNESSKAKGKGKLLIKGVTLASPSSCSVKEEQIKTNLLKWQVVSVKGKTYEEILPAGTEAFFTLTLQKGSGYCPIQGSYIFKGKVFALAEDMGSSSAVHQLSFSSAVQKEVAKGLKEEGKISSEGEASMTFGKEPAWFEGALLENLTGGFGGQFWQAK